MIRPVPLVVVCRNNLALTKLAVRSALAQDHPVEILAVDNCSSDGTAQWLRTKQIVTIFPQVQQSLAWCWNSALQALWAAGENHALVINNDVRLRPDTVRLLSAHGGEFVTCVSVDALDQVGIYTNKNDIPDERERVSVLRSGQRPHPDFSCFMISKTVTDKVGWFDEEYFPAYCEDSVYHVRMHRAGVRAVCVDLPFLHHGAGTIKHASKGEVARIRRGADANRERFRQEYGCLPGSDAYQELFK